jgi:hypothetical protein
VTEISEDGVFGMANLPPQDTGQRMVVWASQNMGLPHDIRVKVMQTRGHPTVRPLVLALALIAAAPIATNAQTTEPRSCQRLHEETSKCEAGMRSCDQHVIARLEAQCQRDEKRLPQVLEPRDGGRP